jgi:hypothetical protein
MRPPTACDLPFEPGAYIVRTSSFRGYAASLVIRKYNVPARNRYGEVV